MYQITAVLNQSTLADVLQGLYDEKIEGVTVTDVMGKGAFGTKRSDLDEKVMLIIVVSSDKYKDKAMEAIRINAQDVGHGSGKMWVTPVLEVERIRTGERNEAALTQSQKSTSHLHVDCEIYSAVDTPAS